MPTSLGPWGASMTTGSRVELSTFWKKRMIMLPRLVLAKPAVSCGARITFLLCALSVLGVPTFYGVAQSQEAEPAVENKVPDKTFNFGVKETTESEPAGQQPAREPDEPGIAELVARFNELIKAERYDDAKLIARLVKEIHPHDPVGEIMLWKVQYRLGLIKTYSPVRNDGKASESQTPTVSIPRRPSSLKAPRHHGDDTAELATRKLKAVENDSGRHLIAAINRSLANQKATKVVSVEYLPQPKFSVREMEIVKKLDQPIAFDFEDQPLATALRQLEKQLGFNIFLDVVSMEKHKLGRNQVVTLKVRDISLKNALKLVLDAHDLTFILEQERMTVLPKLETKLRLETRIYPVRDLVIDKDDFDILIAAIRAGVAPESWLSGERASISKVPASGCLVIFQSPGVHADILQLLRTLRDAKEVPADGAGVGRKAAENPTAGIGIGANWGSGGGFF